MRIGILVVAGAILTVTSLPAEASLTVSEQATANVDCTGGVCSATAKKANLNVGELSAMLASGDVTVKSTAKAKDITIRDAVTWASTHHLTLDANRSISVGAAVSVEGTSALTLTTNHGSSGGTLSFPNKGYVTFWDTHSALTINGQGYLLADSIELLAAIANVAPGANIAIAKSLDLSDLQFAGPPIASPISGKFEGLGNTISNLYIKSSGQAGMFSAMIGPLENLHFTKARITGTVKVGVVGPACGSSLVNVEASGRVTGKSGASTGGLCGTGPIFLVNSHFKGSVSGSGNTSGATRAVGGLVGVEEGTVLNSSSTATVDGADGWLVGGLIGHNEGPVSGNFATGTVRGTDNTVVGGLIGLNTTAGGQFTVTNSYATGFAGGGVGSMVGGLIGQNEGAVSASYASGPVTSGSGNAVGGLIGDDLEENDLTDTYFDTDTTGQSHGVGNDTGYPGVTGLTTEQFQSGLPSGFDPAIWEEKATINNGLPYLLANPPG